MKLYFKLQDFLCFNTKRVANNDLIQTDTAVDGTEIETYAI
jgi:hypothetical protein